MTKCNGQVNKCLTFLIFENEMYLIHVPIPDLKRNRMAFFITIHHICLCHFHLPWLFRCLKMFRNIK